MAHPESELPPDQTAIKKPSRWGTDHPCIGKSTPKIDLKTYALTIDGEVEKPIRLSWSDFLKIPSVESLSDFHCVEGWSVQNCRWTGVGFRRIMEMVRPRRIARSATFECADGYTTSLTLEELSADGVLLAYKLNGEQLDVGYGYPLRLIVPGKYAYKSAMWITRIAFTLGKEMGYWEKKGYSDTADVWKNDRFS